MKPHKISTTAQRAAQLLAKAARFDNGFRRQYPLLVDYIDGRRPLNDCSMAFYRKKVRAHLRLIEGLRQEAARLASAQPIGE